MRDGASVLGACLDALAAQTRRPDEVVVVDNGSSDGSGALARAHAVVSRVVEERAPGSYAARNAGIAAAHGDLLAFTDVDCTPDPGWLAAAVAALEEGADLVAGRIEPDVAAGASVWARYDSALYLDQRHHVEADGFGATANLVVRATVFERIGPFDAALRSSGDLELCRRATAAGHPIAYAHGAVVRHRPRATARALWSLNRRLGAGWAVLRRRGQRPPAWRDPALRIGIGVVAEATASHGAPLRRRQLVVPHAVAMAARWVGRLSGR